MNRNPADSEPLQIGWASADITPEQTVDLHGQHYARVSEGVLDPVTATALALASGEDTPHAVILVSCDLCTIANSLRNAVRDRMAAACPELLPQSMVLNATHTHTGPTAFVPEDLAKRNGAVFPADEVALPVMDPADYIAWTAERIAGAAVAAWRGRSPGALGYGLGHAVVGHNRRVAYNDGVSRMYGDTATAAFSHLEGYEDHDVNLLATWGADGDLTGLVINVACPSQVDENLFKVSADYWHDVRVELRRRRGAELFVLPQCSTAGDQSPRRLWGKAAAERMERLSGRTARGEIAHRIADAVDALLPHAGAERQHRILLSHSAANVKLTRWKVSETEVRNADTEAESYRLEYERLLSELDSDPEKRQAPRWYVPVTRAFRKWRFFAGVRLRFESEQAHARLPAELHVLRLGDVAVATNPFECYLDYGIRIKARSPAVQTFLVQLAGSGSYLPTARSVGGRGYGSAPSSSLVGPEGGSELVEWTVAAIARAFEPNAE
jgi:hypothetical protein